MTEVQTRSEETGLKFHKTIREALDYAEKDKTVWKISFSIGKERVRLVRGQKYIYKEMKNHIKTFDVKYEWILEQVDKISDDVKAQQEWLEKKGTRIKKPEGPIDPNFPKCAGCIRSSHNAHCAWAFGSRDGMRKPKCVDGDKFESKPT